MPPRFRLILLRKCHAVQLLCAGCITHQVEGQSAFRRHLREGDAALLCHGIEPQGLYRAARVGVGAGKPEGYAGIIGSDVFGPAEEPDRCRNISEHKRRIACIDKRRHVSGIARKPLERFAKFLRPGRGKWLHHFLRSGRRCTCGERQQGNTLSPAFATFDCHIS